LKEQTMSGTEARPHWLAWLAGLAALAILALLSSSTAEAGPAEDGKALYVKNECSKCHAVATQGIEVTDPEEEDEEEEEDPFAEEGEEAEPEDLSGIGARWEHGEDGMAKWLTKKLEIEGELHKKKFPGPKKELQALIDWLMTLTEEAPAE
jgi:cytochrome c2